MIDDVNPEIEPIENDEPLTVRDELSKALTEVKERHENTEEELGEKPRIEPKSPPDPVETGNKEVLEPKKGAPTSWNAEVKSKWDAIPQDVQQQILKREEDMNKGFRQIDEERSFARQIKDVVSPYMPIITAEGGTPAGAIQDLLNTAYRLRTASPAEKGQLLYQIAQQYGADMSASSPTQSYVDPQLQQLEQRQRTIEQMIQREQQNYQSQQQNAIAGEIAAFQSDPTRVHFEAVKAHMAALLSSGLAKDLGDAYDQAVYARPDIRSTLLQQHSADSEAKRLADIKSKSNAARNASGSVRGAPGGAVSSKAAPERSLRDELKDNLRAALGN